MYINRKTLIPVTREPHAHVSGITGTIGSEGGELHGPEAGLHIIIPPGALSESVSFSVSPNTSDVGFSVSSTPTAVLSKPARIEQRIPEHAREEPLVLVGIADGEGDNELIGVQVVDDTAIALVQHFSGYLLSSGKSCDPAVVTDGSCVWVENPT